MEDIHLIILGITALFIVVADHDAFSYMRGTQALLSESKTKLLHYGVWTGLILMILTGLTLVLPLYEFYITDPAFIIKMCMVFALVVNGVLIGKLSKVATRVPFKELPSRTKMLLLASGGVSTSGWIGAAVIGYFFL